MQKLVRDYLNELKRKQKKRKRVGTAVVLLVILVIGTVIGGLTQAGVAMTGRAKCGIEEHEHSDGCYENVLACGQEEGEGHQHGDGCYETQSTLTCGMEEEEGHQHDESCYDEAGNLICGTEEAAGHQHDDSCYTTEQILTCEQAEGEGHTHSDACHVKELSCKTEEHTHTEECYIDKKADVEESSKWDTQYEDTEWKETWAENLVIAAEAQIGYKESEDNYEVAEDGNHKGYTRYGQFMDDVYADWDAAFVNFCMHYAGKDDINIEASGVFPKETEAVKWYEEFVGADEKNMSYLVAPQGYEPKAGDLVFFDRKDEEPAFQMGIVSSYDEEKNEIKVIEGNSDNEVKENEYGIKDEDIEENHIFGYLKMDEVEEAYKASEKTAEDDAEPKEDENTEQPQEEIKELTTEVDGTTITLSGPVSSFEEGKEYSIQAEKVENKETIATIEEAIDQVVEEGKKVENYQAFDIKLMVGQEEVQPLGPVEVKFSSKEVAESVENEETEVNVIHVDENTGEATDMEASATEEKDVVIETEHFSVYVYVEVKLDAIGGVKIDIQHWGEDIETIDSAAGGMNGGIKEEAFNTDTLKVITKENTCMLYTTDRDFSLPNETYTDVRKLSKVYNADGEKRYEVTKVWVSKEGKAANCREDAPTWNPNDYDEYTREQLVDANVATEINTLEEGSVIRFWYKPPEEKESVKEPVTFYDYDYSVKNGDTLNTQEKGINARGNYANNGKPKLGAGQGSSGNASSWANNKYDGKFLNAGNGNLAFTGLVGKTLGNDGRVVFNSNIDAPANLFAHNPEGGSYRYDDYQLEFLQNGDTYTLTNVYKGTTKTYAQDLTTFQSRANWNKTKYIYSNDFWPLDDAEHKKDPLLGEKVYAINPPSKTTGGNDVTRIGRGSGNGDNDFQTANGHNWYFGMVYSVEFTLGDYTGPLEYYFRGDDDFWLFVDGKLVVDLGGIHTAIGTTCDLNYLKNEDKNKKHTLTVFYMERGATGSTCYMQFTLPRAKITPLPEPETTSYTVKKRWEDNENGFRPEDVKVTLYKKKGESEGIAVRTINLPLRDTDGNLILDASGKEIWEYTWDDLPKYDGKYGTDIYYYVEEEMIAPENQDNPMLGYDVEIQQIPGGTEAVITNKIKNKKVKVRKEWKDDDKELANRSAEVKFQLYANDKPYLNHKQETVIITLNEKNSWEGEFEHVPEYYYDPIGGDGKGEWKRVKYSVREVPANLSANEINGENGSIYEIVIKEVTSAEDITEGYIACFEATNSLVTKNICIEKIGNSVHKPLLKGAKFDLYGSDYYEDQTGTPIVNINAIPKGTYITDDNGKIDIQGLRFGIYYLVEKEAPSGYLLLDKPIKIEVDKAGVTVDFQIDGWVNGEPNIILDQESGKYLIRIPNELFYELPSTGGSGIYWYMFGGVLLMAGAMLITYRNKRREVLRS